MTLLDIKIYLSEHGITKKIYQLKQQRKEDKINRMSDEEFAQWKYKLRTGRELNLENPQTFDERVWFLKYNVRDPLNNKCSDKYRVREYVKECGLEHILNELYAVYESVEDIDFDKLPDRCFLKCNNASGANMIYDRSKNFDYERFLRSFTDALNSDYYWVGREWNYRHIKPLILSEKVLEDKNGKLPLDYKIMCFAGEPRLLFLDIGVATEQGEHAEEYYRNIYDMDFNLLPVKETRENYLGDEIVKPENWDKMVEYARILSKPFRHCRVDLYNIDGEVYFGEITFHHGGGCNDIQPEEWAYKIGQWIPID